MLEGDAKPADGRTQSVQVTAKERPLWGHRAGPSPGLVTSWAQPLPSQLFVAHHELLTLVPTLISLTSLSGVTRSPWGQHLAELPFPNLHLILTLILFPTEPCPLTPKSE